MTISLNYSSVLNYLKQKQFDASIQTGMDQISAKLSVGKENYPFFVKIDSAGGLVQLLVFLPYALQPSLAPDMARLLHYCNKEIDFPGFGIDEVAGAVFYRCVVLDEQGEISLALFDKVLAAMPRVCEAFFPLITMSMTGKVRFDSILEKARKGVGKK